MIQIARAWLALEGLSVADAFGEQLLHAGPATRSFALGERIMPAVPGVGRRWMWTDDTAMAISIVEVLGAHGGIDPYRLAEAFARHYAAEPARGYGGGAHQVLTAIASGTPFDVAAAALFDGQGSCGNGGGMRSAPIGASRAEPPRRGAAAVGDIGAYEAPPGTGPGFGQASSRDDRSMS